MKTLLYCDKAGDALCAPDGKNFMGYFLDRPVLKTYPDATLNGTVCFECDIEKVEEIVKQDKGYVSTNETLFNTKSMDSFTLRQRSCLTGEEMANYSPKHALYLTNVKAIAPMPITALARRDPTGLNIAQGLASGMLRAPQNMCWAWRWNDKGWERVLVLSLRPRHLCNIANGLKDIETRRKIVKEIKEMEK